MSPKSRNRRQRASQVEQFEPRLAMSGQALADPLDFGQLEATSISAAADLETQLSNTVAAAGVTYARGQFGFDGQGQTVAIIDTGIAWDHSALGGGFGTGHHVVGGWDFAENDALPYDDGPAGFHGTHVGGIIGSTHSVYRGVAAGADIVALRVFNDQGQGQLAWVEKALRWVHEHRDSFANPITTVNLSLGLDWNSNSVPSWATLEDEFQQLSLDGMFVSVAAGNSFAEHQVVGVSYPAASPWVIPVASHNGAGQFSNFSQRNNRVLVAPGQSITSTVPNHLFGGQQSNQFLGASGTSMAAPFVAGASALVRQAMELAGLGHISPQAIYDHLRQTSDQMYDAVTHASYHRVNLQRALDSLLVDRHGDTVATAKDLGTINGGETATGLIGRLSDVDVVSFTASRTGRLTLALTGDHDLGGRWHSYGSGAVAGNQLVIDVVAGQQYQVGVSTTDGLGNWTIKFDLKAAPNAIDWGRVESARLAHQSLAGEQWFSLQAARSGVLTVAADAQQVGQAMKLQLYDEQMRLIGSAVTSPSGLRLDAVVTGNALYFVRLEGSATGVSLDVANLVSLADGHLKVTAPLAVSAIDIRGGSHWTVTVGGFQYQFASSAVTRLSVWGQGAADSLSMWTGGRSDTVELNAAGAKFQSGWTDGVAWGFSSIMVHGGAGFDRVTLVGTAGSESATGMLDRAALEGGWGTRQAFGFEQIALRGAGGADVVRVVGSAGDDVLTVADEVVQLRGAGKSIEARDFAYVRVIGGGGSDRAGLAGTSGADTFQLSPTEAVRQTSRSRVVAERFDDVGVTAGLGADRVSATGSSGFETWSLGPGWMICESAAGRWTATGFGNVAVSGSGGGDRATLFDTPNGDAVYAGPGWAFLVSTSHVFEMTGMSHVVIVASRGGSDYVTMVGGAGNDALYGTLGWAALSGPGYYLAASGFVSTTINASGGYDTGQIVGTSKSEQWEGSATAVSLRSSSHQLIAHGLVQATLDGRGGGDQLTLRGFGAGDSLWGTDSWANAAIDGTTILASGFVWLDAIADGGGWAARDVSAVDYWYALHGNWT